MNVFYKNFCSWLRRPGFHDEWATRAGIVLAEHVEARLATPYGDDFDIRRDPFLDESSDRNNMVLWLHKNEHSGYGCSPPWTRNFSRAVWLALRKNGASFFDTPLTRENFYALDSEWRANGGKEYERQYMSDT